MYLSKTSFARLCLQSLSCGENNSIGYLGEGTATRNHTRNALTVIPGYLDTLVLPWPKVHGSSYCGTISRRGSGFVSHSCMLLCSSPPSQVSNAWPRDYFVSEWLFGKVAEIYFAAKISKSYTIVYPAYNMARATQINIHHSWCRCFSTNSQCRASAISPAWYNHHR